MFPNIQDHFPNVGNKIKSIQRGSFTKTANLRDAVINISPVDISKSILLYYAKRTGGSGNNSVSNIVNLTLASSNAITAYFTESTSTSSDSTFEISWTVVEFQSGVKVQRGIAFTSPYSCSVTINPVNINKTIAFCDMISYESTLWNGHPKPYNVQLTSPTTLFLEGEYQNRMNWQVLEFK